MFCSVSYPPPSRWRKKVERIVNRKLLFCFVINMSNENGERKSLFLVECCFAFVFCRTCELWPQENPIIFIKSTRCRWFDGFFSRSSERKNAHVNEIWTAWRIDGQYFYTINLIKNLKSTNRLLTIVGKAIVNNSCLSSLSFPKNRFLVKWVRLLFDLFHVQYSF